MIIDGSALIAILADEPEKRVFSLTITSAPTRVMSAATAVDAFRRFGKGRHPAGLNFGDCFSYALAKATDEPLFFKGADFSQTDIQRAV